MADSAVVVTAGTGTNIDTRTEATNGNHRQVVVLGDPATNAGVAPVDATAGLKVDLGADNDITGTVTANLSATDNAVLDDIAADTESIKTAVEILDNTVAGSELQVDIVSGTITAVTAITNALPAGTNVIGRVGHDITGISHGVTTVTTAGTDVALASSTVCKRVTIQSQTDNTGLIAVGGSGIDATVATGTGVILYPGDVFELEIDNLADIYIDSTVSGEGVRYTYFT